MTTNHEFRALALSFPEISESAHFEKISFRVGKKIVATLNEKENRACVKLNEIDQHVFASFDRTAIYPVPNKWGKQGWTFIELSKVNPDMLTDALTTAFREVAPKRLSKSLSQSAGEELK